MHLQTKTSVALLFSLSRIGQTQFSRPNRIQRFTQNIYFMTSAIFGTIVEHLMYEFIAID